MTPHDPIFHFLTEKKLATVLGKNEIKPRWKHYIEREGRLVVGTSFTWDVAHGTVVNMEYPVRLVCDRRKLERQFPCFVINSSRVYWQTLAMTKPELCDPNAYQLEDGAPDELFVEGTIKPLSEYLLGIEVLRPVSDETSLLIGTYRAARL